MSPESSDDGIPGPQPVRVTIPPDPYAPPRSPDADDFAPRSPDADDFAPRSPDADDFAPRSPDADDFVPGSPYAGTKSGGIDGDSTALPYYGAGGATPPYQGAGGATPPYQGAGGATPPMPGGPQQFVGLLGPRESLEEPQRLQTFLAERFFQGWEGAWDTRTDAVGKYSVTPAGTARAIARDLLALIKECRCAIVDGTACIGGDSAAFSRVFAGGVTAIEQDECRFGLLRNNLVDALHTGVRCIRGSCLEVAPTLRSQIYYLDPPWGGRGHAKSQKEAKLYLGDSPLHRAVRPRHCPRGCLLLAIKTPPNFNLHRFRRRVARHWAWHWSGSYMQGKIHVHAFRRISRTERGGGAIDPETGRLVRWHTRSGRTRLAISKSQMKRIADVVVDRCLRSQMEQGDPIGHWAASGIGEDTTQGTLNSIHKSGGGQSLMERTGMPRFNEITSASPHPGMPMSRLAIVPGISVPERKAQALASVPLNRILENFYLVHDPLQRGEPWTKIDRDVLTCCLAAGVYGSEQEAADASFLRASQEAVVAGTDAPPPLIPSEYVVRLELNAQQCRERGITPEMVAARTQHLPNAKNQPLKHATVVFSGAASPMLVVRLRPWATEEDDLVLTERFGNQLVTYCEQKLEVGGVSDISATMSTKERLWRVAEDGSLQPYDAKIVLAQGSNLSAITRYPWIDTYNCDTNDTVEVLRSLGLMACRFVVQRELRKVLCGQAKVSKIEERHIRVLSYAICTRGFFVVVTRHGLNQEPTDALHRIAYEQLYNILSGVARHGQADSLGSTTSAIAVNARAPIGTGMVSVISDRKQELTNERFSKSQYGHLISSHQQQKFRRQGVEELSRRRGHTSVARARMALQRHQKQWPAAPVDLDRLEEDAEEEDEGKTREEDGADTDGDAGDGLEETDLDGVAFAPTLAQSAPASGAGADTAPPSFSQSLAKWARTLGEPEHDVRFMDAAFHDYDPDEDETA